MPPIALSFHNDFSFCNLRGIGCAANTLALSKIFFYLIFKSIGGTANTFEL